MKVFALVCILLGFSSPAFSNVTVLAPASGAQVSSPFALTATASPCSSQAIAAMGYSLDNSTNTTIVYSTTVNAQIAGTIGSHVLHVKSWGNQGAVCVTNVSITVVAAATVSMPSTAIEVSGIQKHEHGLVAHHKRIHAKIRDQL